VVESGSIAQHNTTAQNGKLKICWQIYCISEMIKI
jgi:hypothetical protein